MNPDAPLTIGYVCAALAFGACFCAFISFPLWAPRIGAAVDRAIRRHVEAALDEPSNVRVLDNYRTDNVVRIRGAK